MVVDADTVVVCRTSLAGAVVASTACDSTSSFVAFALAGGSLRCYNFETETAAGKGLKLGVMPSGDLSSTALARLGGNRFSLTRGTGECSLTAEPFF